jgi:hypothetical protein
MPGVPTIASRCAAVAALCMALGLGTVPPALAHDGRDDDVRVEGDCGTGASSQLRLKADHGAIRVEFEVKSRRARERWRVVLVHERRVVWRGRVRTRSGSASFRVRRSIPDLEGADGVSMRGSGPNGNTCLAATTLTAG